MVTPEVLNDPENWSNVRFMLVSNCKHYIHMESGQNYCYQAFGSSAQVTLSHFQVTPFSHIVLSHHPVSLVILQPHPPVTPSIHTIHSHHPFTPSIHTIHSHHPFTPSIHTIHSHHPFTPSIHTIQSHHPVTPSSHTIQSHFPDQFLFF